MPRLHSWRRDGSSRATGFALRLSTGFPIAPPTFVEMAASTESIPASPPLGLFGVVGLFGVIGVVGVVGVVGLEGQGPVRRSRRARDLANHRSGPAPVGGGRHRPGIDADRAHAARRVRRTGFRWRAAWRIRDRGDLEGQVAGAGWAGFGRFGVWRRVEGRVEMEVGHGDGSLVGFSRIRRIWAGTL